MSGPGRYGATRRELDLKSGGGLFARMWRTAACEKVRNPRHPSIARNSKGELLLLLTYEPEGREGSVLGLVRSNDEGRSWSDARTVYRPARGTPQALGTLTRLRSGKLVAPFREGPGLVRMLLSEDDGHTWNSTNLIDCLPLHKATPYGRLAELEGELLMSVFGRLPVDGKEAPCSGLLRSTDNGQTWGWLDVIACDLKEGKIAYGPTAVHADPSGQLLALISVGNTFLYRSISMDGGKTWSEAEQRLLACNPALAAVGSTLACVDQDPQHRGIVRVQFSEDLFDSWRCDRMLDQDIKGEYFSAIGLDGDRLLLVHDRGTFKPEGRGTTATEGIEVAMMQRNPNAPPLSEKLILGERRDRWEPVETLSTSIETGFGEVTQGPDDTLYALSGERIYASGDGGLTFQQVAKAPRSGLLGVLRSGRWLIASAEFDLIDWNGQAVGLETPDGYAYFKLNGVRGTTKVWIYSSDDRGKTWNGADRPMDIKPLVWANPYGRFLEESDGTVIMTVYGCLSEEDTSGRMDCCGLFRSKDGGTTWGDFSLVGYDNEFHEIAYNEMDIQPMPDGVWVAAMRTEWRSHHGGEASSSSVSFSRDRGRTWTKPEFAFIGAVPALALLPDGGLVCASSFNKLRFSYDGGHTWSREVPSHTNVYPLVQLVRKDHLFVCGRWQGREGCIYRRVSAERKERT